MLLLEMNSRYYGYIAARMYQRDIGTKIFLACLSSSGAIAGWTVWNSPEHPTLAITWKLLSAVAALLAVALPFLNYAKKLECATRLKTEYAELHREASLLWLNIDEAKKGDVQKELKKLWDKEAKLAAFESNFPVEDRSLLKKCQTEVTRSTGAIAGGNQ